MKINNLNETSRDDLLILQSEIKEELDKRNIFSSLYNMNDILRQIIKDYSPSFVIKTPLSGINNFMQFTYNRELNVIEVNFYES